MILQQHYKLKGGEIMRRILLFVFSIFIYTGLFAQQPVVAVAFFDAISGISETEANMITRVFYIRLGNTNKVKLVDRSIVERIIKEQQFQAGDWADERKTAELGKALPADWIVRGALERWGTNILITVEFYDIKTFQFKGGSDLRLSNADEAYDKIDPLVDKLIQIIAANTVPAPAYKIGDRGPGGGFIFFAESGVYMECSLDIGTFKWDDAVIAAKNHRGGGFSDWTLPTINELNLMSENLSKKGLGGFGSFSYWSSSQSGKDYAYNIAFGGGYNKISLKKNVLSVRAVRSFNK
jgi:TolB-like protein